MLAGYSLLKDLKKGDFFKLSAESSVVYVKEDYCREEKKYICSRFDDFCDFRTYKGSKVVFIDFIF